MVLINTAEASPEEKKLAAHYAYLQVSNYDQISDDGIKQLKSKGAHFDV